MGQLNTSHITHSGALANGTAQKFVTWDQSMTANVMSTVIT
jgi:hypothetical protein